MSTTNLPGDVMPDAARAALADLAALNVRRNQPRFLIVAASGALIVAGLMLIAGVWERSTAREKLEVQRGLTSDLRAAVSALLAAKEEQRAMLGSDAFKPNPFLASQIEQVGKDAGLVNVTIQESPDGRSGPQGFKRQKYSANTMPPQDIEAILAFADKVPKTIPGVELSSLDLTPAAATHDGKPRWTGSIAFSRWETKDSK